MQMKYAFRIIIILAFTSLIMGCASIREARDMGIVKTGSDGRLTIDFLAFKQLSGIDCGAACLSFVLQHWGNPYSIKEIETKLKPPQKTGYSLSEMKDFATQKGFVSFLFSGTIDDVRKHTALLKMRKRRGVLGNRGAHLES